MKRTVVVAAALLATYAIGVTLYPARDPKGQSQVDQNRITLESYVTRADAPDIVFVGSSLTTRLPVRADPSFGCAFNASLAGGSALTGLEAVAHARLTPKILLVEANYLHRPVNAELLSGATNELLLHLPVFRTENKPMNRLWTIAYGMRGKQSSLDHPLEQAALQVQQQMMSRPIAQDELTERVSQVRALVMRLRERGTRVIMYEMPVHPSIAGSTAAMQLRTAVRTAFADLEFIDASTLSGNSPVTTTDGIHLASSEARAVMSRFPMRCGADQKHPPAKPPIPA